MQPNKHHCVLLVLRQPGAETFFKPVISRIRDIGWEVAVNQEPETVSPSVIVTSTSYVAEERHALEWARGHGVRCAQLVDSWYDYGRRIELTNGPGLLPDEIWIFDEAAREGAMSEGLSSDLLRIAGNPAWEAVPALPKASKSSILIVDQPVGSDMGCRLGYDEQDFLQLVRDGLKDVSIHDREVVLALHPRRSEQMADFNFVTEISRDTRDALRRCGTVVGMFSSLLIDAFLGGRCVVSVQPNAGAIDFCILSHLGLTPRVTVTDQLRDAIDRAAPGPQGFDARFIGSGQRVCDALAELAVPVTR